MSKFKKGDKIRYVHKRLPPGSFDNHHDYAGEDGLVPNEVYTVKRYIPPQLHHAWFEIKESTIHNWAYQEWQFERAKFSNEERIAKRMEELNNANT